MSIGNQQIRALAERVAASHGLEVVDLEFVGGGGKHRVLRITIERNAAGRAALADRLRGLRDAGAGPSEPVESTAGRGEEGSIVLDLAEADAAVLSTEVLGTGVLSTEEEELAYLRNVPSHVPIAQLSGVTHKDCAVFSRDFSVVIDVEDLVSDAEYLLEVSSPGLERKLSRAEEFERFAGLLCKVETFTPVAGSRNWQGHLGGVSNGIVRLIPQVPKPARKKKKAAASEPPVAEVDLALGNIEKAQLVPEF